MKRTIIKKVRVLVWLSFAKSSSATAGASGWNPNPGKAPLFISPYPKESNMESTNLATFLLVEDPRSANGKAFCKKLSWRARPYRSFNRWYFSLTIFRQPLRNKAWAHSRGRGSFSAVCYLQSRSSRLSSFFIWHRKVYSTQARYAPWSPYHSWTFSLWAHKKRHRYCSSTTIYQ